MNDSSTALRGSPSTLTSRITAASERLRASHPHVPQDFVALLFGRAPEEDVAAYTADELAAAGADAWHTLQQRAPEHASISVHELAAADGSRLKTVSVVELVNDDMPFLVDSVMAELTDRGLAPLLIVHPILGVTRDKTGNLTAPPAEAGDEKAVGRESLIHVHVPRLDDGSARTALIQALTDVLTEVRRAVTDWRQMVQRVRDTAAGLKANPPPIPVGDIAEAIQFLQWIANDNFTLLGIRDYAFTGADRDLAPVLESGLGVMRGPEVPVLRRGGVAATITPQLRAFFESPRTLIVAKANVKSRVHRRVYLDYIGVKRFDADGNAIGETRIVGLFTSTVYIRETRSIPYLRRKVDAVLTRAGFNPETHSGKALVNVLETYPRDELFQIDEDTLYEFALTILQLEERPRIRVLARRDPFDRFVSVLVYVPRDRYSGAIRAQIGAMLAEAFEGHVSAYYPNIQDAPLTRVHFIIGRNAGPTPNPDRTTLEAKVAEIVRTWADGLGDAIAGAFESGRSTAFLAKYRDAFPAGYRDAYTPAIAVQDIRDIEALTPERPLAVHLYARTEDGQPCIGLKVWSLGRPIPLSERVPVLENMGFRVVDERTFEVAGAVDAWLHDMAMERADGGDAAIDKVKAGIETAFIMAMRGVAENDGYNALVLVAGLGWRDVALLRTISRFLRQVRVPYSQDYMWATLRKHSTVARLIVELFHARFKPADSGRDDAKDDRAKRETGIVAEIEKALEAVTSLDEDRIVRRFVNAVQSAVRTNTYQLGKGGQPKPEISIKFSSRKLDGVPKPAPLYEIFVYSPRFEADHLRFGKVARGGIRWSDRPQDFRTEVLGLVKAQQVKNAVIVPVGSKGGYVPKQMPVGGAREAIQAEGTATYKLFMQALLDITDNYDKDKVVHPDNVVRHDDDDPYLVVAADKGTATFSDFANAISTAHHFWLGDAFASGGSAGYDHKAMGITARGAWESVKRHFREMDTDITQQAFTTVGVGDMSGDVFGNGMLRETTMKLVAAFDHRDIFIDPTPDPKKSFEERQRLFKLPRSSWQDYDKALISKGGGIFPRSLKEIALSTEAQAALGFDKAKATPQEVMSAILKAPVDLLFFGGIGTYIRASSESDEAAGDRANDAIRITGNQLRAKVVGEGANLGMTQRGRIEAAHAGVRLNTDAIDNSAGVNTSDVEVNIKIALSLPMSDGRLSLEDRNTLLSSMTDEVAQVVLRNNYLQTLALSLAQRRGLEDLGFQQRLMQSLEQRGELERAIEFLPDDVELAERAKREDPLTRPELSVLLAYAKISLYSELLDTDVPDDPYLGRELGRYFPDEIAKRYPDALEKHRLRREIIATQLANSIVNRGGPAVVVRLADQTGAAPGAIVKAFAAVRDSYEMPERNERINALDGKVAGKLQLQLYAAIQDLLLDRLVWFLRNVDLSKGLAGIVERYRTGIATVAAALKTALPEHVAAAREARRKEYADAGVPEALAAEMADLPILTAAPDIILIAERTGKPIDQVLATYFAAAAHFRLDRVVEAARSIAAVDYFDRLALDRALDSIGDSQRRLTAAMVGTDASGEAAVSAWAALRKADAERIRSAIQQIAGSGLTQAKLSVAASLLGDLAKPREEPAA